MGVFQIVPNYVKYQITMNLRFLSENIISTGIYMFKVNNRNSRTRCEICSKLTIKTPERRQWNRTRQNRHLHCHRHYKKFIFGSRIFFLKKQTIYVKHTSIFFLSLFISTNKSGVLKVGLSPSKKNYIDYFNGKLFKNDEKFFLFYLKSSFRSQDI